MEVLGSEGMGRERYMKPAFQILVAFVAFAAPASNAQTTDVLVEQLRQDVRELHRVVREQARQLERLEREIARLKASPGKRAARASDTAPTGFDGRWLSAAAWQKVRASMSELEVIEILGPPRAIRGKTADSKTLIYTLELEGTGYLSGSVLLRNGRVTEVSEPKLL
jgi:hypothetical protein